MNLKESYRYANYLEDLLSSAYRYLSNDDFITSKVERHFRSKANPDASDEDITAQKPYDVDFAPIDIVNFIVGVFDEKEKLTNAIADAKLTTEINIDTSISLNKKKKNFIYTLNHMVEIKSSETKGTARGYKFDINGEQKPYNYETAIIKTINYDRNEVKALAKKLQKECDEVSAKLDSIEINTQVNFEPKFDITDKLEDLIGV